MGAKGKRQGWQRHSVDEYREYIDDNQHLITAPIDPELLYPTEDPWRDDDYAWWLDIEYPCE